MYMCRWLEKLALLYLGWAAKEKGRWHLDVAM